MTGSSTMQLDFEPTPEKIAWMERELNRELPHLVTTVAMRDGVLRISALPGGTGARQQRSA
jgi:hypothetical protein